MPVVKRNFTLNMSIFCRVLHSHHMLISCQHEQVHFISIKPKYSLRLGANNMGAFVWGLSLPRTAPASPPRPAPMWFESEGMKGTKTCFADNFFSSSSQERQLFVLTFRNAISDEKKLPKGCSQKISSIKSSAGNDCSVQAFYV